MKLIVSRELSALRPVMMEPEASGPDPVYRVFSDLEIPGWRSKTVLEPGRLGKEFPKTFGHYHTVNTVETYAIVSGEGVVTLQKKDAGEVLLVFVRAGDRVPVPAGFGHSLSNTGQEELVALDDWEERNAEDYLPIKDKHGMAYYLTEENGKVTAKPNPNYSGAADPKWLTADQLRTYGKTNR